MSNLREFDEQWVLVARILRPRGNKGEVVAELLTDFPSRFSTLKEIYVRKANGEPNAAGLRRFWLDQNHPGMGIFHFGGYTNISEAEKLRGYEVVVPFEERVKLSAGQYFVTDLIGCTVFELPAASARLASPACAMEDAPRVIGAVRDVFFPGEAVKGTPLLQVESGQGELLVPLAEDICVRIDVTERRIEVNLPEGLNDLNARE